MASKGIQKRNTDRLYGSFYYAVAEQDGSRKRAILAEEAKRKETEEIDRVCRYILGIEDENDTTKRPKA